MHVVIRCDSSSTIGVGHVARMIAVAEALNRLDIQCTFLGSVGGIEWLERELDSRWKWVETGKSLSETLSILDTLTPDVLVIDSYSEELGLASSTRETGVKVVVVADSFTPQFDSDLVVVPALDELDPSSFGPQALFLAGLDYVLIRDSIKNLRSLRTGVDVSRKLSSHLEIWIVMGGTDAMKMIETLARQVNIKARAKIHFAPSNSSAITSGTGSNQSVSISYHKADRLLFGELVNADLVVSAAGVSVFELLYLGLPIALIQVVDNQSHNYRTLTDLNLCVPLTDDKDMDTQEIWSRIDEIVGTRDLAGYSQRGCEAVDGKGADRLARAISELDVNGAG